MDVGNALNNYWLHGLNPTPLCSCSLTFAFISVSFLTAKQKIQHEALQYTRIVTVGEKNLMKTLL
jgi:hypothetical protein